MGNFTLSEKTGILHPKSGNKISRRGNTNRPRCTLNQALKCGSRAGKFIAVIFDPESGERLQEVMLWAGTANETVEMALEWEPDSREAGD